ncbi:pyruvate, phosphate dikinase, chloroplastic [Tanacetum coccineum]
MLCGTACSSGTITRQVFAMKKLKKSKMLSRGQNGLKSTSPEGRTGGGGCSSAQKRKLTTIDVLTYLKDVYQRADIAGVVASVKDCFNVHNDLLAGFNVFRKKINIWLLLIISRAYQSSLRRESHILNLQNATDAKFFSYGTNDLTQMTFRYSLDDVGKFLPGYLAQGLLEHDPFKLALYCHFKGGKIRVTMVNFCYYMDPMAAYSGNKETSSKDIEDVDAVSKALSTILIYTESTKVYKKDQTVFFGLSRFTVTYNLSIPSRESVGYMMSTKQL